jgi:hypothetical protein
MKRTTKRGWLAAAFTILGTVTLFGNLSCDKAEEAFDCSEVCQRYADCYDSGYDVSGCESRCRTRAASDPSVQSAASTCESCIGDKSCISATFNCGDSCSSIVP